MKFNKKRAVIAPLNLSATPETAPSEEPSVQDAGPCADPPATADEAAAAPFELERAPPLAPPAASPALDEVTFGRRAYVFALIGASLWAGCVVAFAMVYQGRDWSFEFRPAQTVLLVLVASLPSAFVFLLAKAFQDGARLANEARRARALSDEMVAPAALAASHAGGVMDVVRHEIDRAVAAAEQARDHLSLLRESLAEETRQITLAAESASRAARDLSQSLAGERVELDSLSRTLSQQAEGVAQSLAEHTRLVSDASDLAQAQLQEAEAALVGRVADFAAAAGDAREAAALAAGQLAEQAERLETAGDDASTRLGRLWTGLSVERDMLAGLLERLKSTQDEAVVRLEAQRVLLGDAADTARDGAEEMLAAARETADSLKSQLVEVAAEVDLFADRARAAHDGLDQTARTTLSLFVGAVADERSLLESEARAAIAKLSEVAAEARESARQHAATVRADIETLAETARHRLDELGEAAFSAGQRADAALDSQMTAARRVVEESATLVEAAGLATARRIEASFGPVRAALGDLESLLGALERQADRLPAEAQARTAAVRKAVEQGVGELTAAARHAAEEAQAIDAAFQERVRRNYEMLHEAVRLMGQVAGATPVEALAAEAVPPMGDALLAEEPALPEDAAGLGLRGALDLAPADDAELEEPVLHLPAAKAPTPPPQSASDPPPTPTRLRPRLRLTPTAEDDAVKTVFQGAAGAQPRRERPAATPAAQDGWTWKELLSGMEGDRVDDDILAERLIGEIQSLGVDTTALLPRARIDEISRTVTQGGFAAGHDLVRKVAPAAVRRLSRRIAEDRALRRDVEGYVKRYESLIRDQAAFDQDGGMAETLLGSDPGRAFLLLGAAVGDAA